MLVVLTSAGCSTAPSKESGQPPDQPYYERSRMMISQGDTPLAVDDPWEGMNRSIYRFNSYADRYVLNPAVSVYRFIFPGFVRKGVSNFFTNLDNIQTVINEIFQLHPGSAVQTTGRFLVNTTIGIAGLWDPATPIGIPQHYEDFGQTLGRWGFGAGAYVVWPVLGPSSVRDSIALPADRWFASPAEYIKDGRWQGGITALQIVNTRANLLGATKLLDDIALDKYSFIRDAYLQRRRSLVYDGDAPEVPEPADAPAGATAPAAAASAGASPAPAASSPSPAPAASAATTQ